ncbi:MAG: type II toxin-antitoxin system VapC family toxin [Candidatus Sabulitectum sp.]|nr:type II toxin-antitoxin system VapC family toxin [Candidatus Sabulitectum sp.]
MNYLLDTCVISEMTKKDPSRNVTGWISEIEESHLFLSVFSIGEIHKGIERLSSGRRKEELSNWVTYDLTERFRNRIIDFDLHTAEAWGKIQAQSELKGNALPAIDGLIAATGISHDLIVVTRNTKDMEISGVALLNPWEPRQ